MDAASSASPSNTFSAFFWIPPDIIDRIRSVAESLLSGVKIFFGFSLVIDTLVMEVVGVWALHHTHKA